MKKPCASPALAVSVCACPALAVSLCASPALAVSVCASPALAVSVSASPALAVSVCQSRPGCFGICDCVVTVVYAFISFYIVVIFVDLLGYAFVIVSFSTCYDTDIVVSLEELFIALLPSKSTLLLLLRLCLLVSRCFAVLCD